MFGEKRYAAYIFPQLIFDIIEGYIFLIIRHCLGFIIITESHDNIDMTSGKKATEPNIYSAIISERE
jgi:hypothetical protein